MEPQLIYNRADLARLCSVTEKTLGMWLLKNWLPAPQYNRPNGHKYWSEEQVQQVLAWSEARKR